MALARGETRSGQTFSVKKKVYYKTMTALERAHEDLYADEASFFVSGKVHML
jgi:hypothetical protein